jgi:CheY-like chemotaxis protein
MKAPREDEQPIVVIIDDDPEIRETLEDLIHSVGLHAEPFASVQELMGRPQQGHPARLVLDVRLPGRSGLESHDDLIKANVHLPVDGNYVFAPEGLPGCNTHAISATHHSEYFSSTPR